MRRKFNKKEELKKEEREDYMPLKLSPNGIDLSDEKLLDQARATAKKYGRDFDALPNGLQITMAMSELINNQSSSDNSDCNLNHISESGVIYPQSISTGNPKTLNMLPVFGSYPEQVQLTLEHVLKKDGYLDRILSDTNISDRVKYSICNAINNLSNDNIRTTLSLNVINAFYALIERSVKFLSDQYGIDISISQIIEHPTIQHYAKSNLTGQGVMQYILDSTPIPIIVHYTCDGEYMYGENETTENLRELTDSEYMAVITALNDIKSKKFALELYEIYCIALRDVIYSSNTLNGYLDLSTLYNLCVTNTSFLFKDLEMQIKAFLCKSGSIALYNAAETQMREGLIFEIDEDDE